MNDHPLLSVHHLSGKMGSEPAVENVSFFLNHREQLVIAGETGSGKTTLLKMLAGLLQPDGGEVLFNGERVKGPYEQLIAGHSRIAYLSQYFELRNNYIVKDLLEITVEGTKEEADRIYQVCRIAHLLDRRTSALSGGERQRIALARLLTSFPSVLLLDEPFSHLDFVHKEIIRQVLSDIRSEFSTSFILVSHDVSDVLSWADRLIVLKAGRILSEGDPKTLFYKPGDTYTAGLMGAFCIIDGPLAAAIDPSINYTQNLFYYLRPSQLTITQDLSFPEAIVSDVQFFGHYHLITAKCLSQTVQLTEVVAGLQPGDIIRIRTRVGETLYPVKE